jgi:hypothetical protein
VSEVIAWIAGAAESEDVELFPLLHDGVGQDDAQPVLDMPTIEHFPTSGVPAVTPEQRATPELLEQLDVTEELIELDRRQRVYRGRTAAMLRKYMRYSLETGRLPSLIGREFFRSKVTSYRVTTFEDRVIFVHDMETCLERLTEFSGQVIARSILQEHDLPATARLIHCNEKTIRRAIPMALDELIEILLEVGLLEGLDLVRERSV